MSNRKRSDEVLRPRKGIVLRLAGADLLHEWILTLCMILALAAIIAPLLIVLGLKEGIVAHLRNDLVQDPVNREIRPKTTQDLSEDWLAEIAARPDVEFMMPSILRGASIVRVATIDGRQTEAVDLLPSGTGDPLLLSNGAQPPVEGEAVVSMPLAQKFGLKAGDSFVVQVTRTVDGRPEAVAQTVKVRSVLGIRGDTLARVYAPLAFVVDVEAYKEGNAVLARGWAGQRPIPYGSYDGAIVMMDTPLDSLALRGLTIGTGFSNSGVLSPGDVATRFGIPALQIPGIYEVSVVQKPTQESSLTQLAGRLRGREALILPYVKPIAATYAGKKVDLVGLALSEAQATRRGFPILPWAGLAAGSPVDSYLQIAAPADWGVSVDTSIDVTVPSLSGPLMIPLRVTATAPGAVALIPTRLASMLRTGADRTITYSAQDSTLLLTRSGYRGFRLYARAIEDVPAIAAALDAAKVPTVSRLREIQGLTSFSTGLDDLFRLVAIVAVVGGMAALLASLYAAVERKKRDISMMRLLGLSPMRVAGFPIYQGAFVAIGATLVAFAGFFAVGALVDRLLAVELNGEHAVVLQPELMGLTIGLILALSVVSALLAARKTTMIEPAEAIRVE